MFRTALAVALVAAPFTAARAGDVEIAIKGSNLVLNGSPGADLLVLSEAFGIVTVGPGLGTTLNGLGASFQFAVPGKDLRVELGGGADSFTLLTGSFPRDVRIDTGAGADLVSLASLSVERDLRVDLGADGGAFGINDSLIGDDLLLDLDQSMVGPVVDALSNTYIGDRLRIKGKNASVLALSALSVGGSTKIALTEGLSSFGADACAFAADVAIKAAGTGTYARLQDCSVEGDCSVSGKGGDFRPQAIDSSIEGTLKFQVAAPKSLWLVHGCALQRLRVAVDASIGSSGRVKDSVAFDAAFELEGGADAVDLVNSWFDAALRADLGSGGDQITATGLHVGGDAKFELGSGGDAATITTVDFLKDLDIECGKGDDTVAFTDVYVGGEQDVDPGSGNDVVP